ncbi:hypothetical protein [Candidatus Jidaibacter acanthamoebae]|nr:hypothetical protein [Candidatus Jidaibacter acanthamoeba]
MKKITDIIKLINIISETTIVMFIQNSKLSDEFVPARIVDIIAIKGARITNSTNNIAIQVI